LIGQQLSHYTIVDKIGEGGMGAVYRAIDTRLNRTVAIKVLQAQTRSDPDRQRRFLQEAQSASALNHPNIVNIFEIDSASGVDFIAMEHVDGTTLESMIAGSALPIGQALEYAIQIASALAAAHEAGIIHRDVKPGNVLVSRSGHVKVLDFGLAKLMHSTTVESAAPTQSAVPATASGVVVGTAAYMSPEQAEGQPLDARTDVFAFGALLYEMVTGRRAFQGRSVLSTMAAVLHEQPVPVRELRPDAPEELQRIVLRCLEKDPQKRYQSAAELGADLHACHAAAAASGVVRSRTFGVPLVVALVAIVIVAAAVVTMLLVRGSRAKWARNVALPEVEALVTRGQPDHAFRLVKQVQAIIPDDPQIARIVNNVTDPAVIRTTPDGAQVSTKFYLDPAGEWIKLGTTPLENVLVPFGYHRWQITKEGYETREVASGPRIPMIALTRTGEGPPGMVLIPATANSTVTPPAQVDDFWIDRFEVTNREYKVFVDAGGYTKRSYWKQPFVEDGAEIPWATAMQRFRDATGQPGPAGWELSTYPESQADLPVTGVSWYEAAAYAEYAGKSLPTYYHWYQAAALSIYSEILVLSNFSGKGLAKVGEYQGLGPFGTYDMAGNAKEWCFNNTGSRRYILGGAWNEPSYMFTERDAQSPFDRKPNHGFRCAKYTKPPALPLVSPVDPATRDYTKERPATDETFKVFQSLYAYDRAPLHETVEALPDDSPLWRREQVTVDAAYANERVPGFLFLPRNVQPPFQTVIFFPPGGAFVTRSNAYLDTRQVQFLIQSGRAVLYPIYRGTFDRWVQVRGASEDRDLTIQDAKDFSRMVDYLETRSDIDRNRLGYFGNSSGAVIAPLILAIDQRMKAAALVGGAFPVIPMPPEVDPINFAPRVTAPVLMLNGRYDFVEPVETSQKPMFRMLGTRPEDKRHMIFETGHAIVTVQPLIKEVLDWFDRYLGPVNR
jgi:predicted esterase